MIPPLSGWDELTLSWLADALAGQLGGSELGGARVEPLGDGTNRRARVHLDYRAGKGPASVFVKIQGRALSRLALLSLGAFASEARLAGSGVELPIESPRAFAAAVDWRRLRYVVVTEDVAALGGRPNDATRPLGPAEVSSGLAGLASLHAAFWGRRLPPSLGFLEPWRLRSGWALISRASLARGMRRLERLGQAQLVRRSTSAAVLERQFRRSAVLASRAPQTVLHGDPHPGNTYALGEGRTGFYDWQLVRRGSWSHDVGYFLAGSLAVEDRRRHERELLAGYLEALRRAGAEAPGAGEAWDGYRATPAFGLGTWLHTLSAAVFQPEAICFAMIERFAAAYDDLGTAASAAGRSR